MTSTSNTIFSWLGCSRHSTHKKGFAVPVFKLVIAPLLHGISTIDSATQDVTAHFKSSTCQTTWAHITAIISYGGGERWRWSERRRERKRGVKLSVTMAASFFLFFFSAKSPSEKCVFINGVGCCRAFRARCPFAALRIPFCVSVEIRERTISVFSLQRIIRAAHTHRIQIRPVCCLYG